MSEDDSVKHEGKWTRRDLPSWDKIRDADDMAGNGLRSRVIDIALNEVVEHLNTHYPKPAPDLLSSAAECVLGAEDRAKAAKRERDEWKARADQLRDERDDAVQSCIAVGRERDAAVARADHAEKGAWRVRYQHAVAELLDAGRARDEWKARAEKAEADLEELSEEFADFRVEVVAEAVKYRELNPPVFDVDVERTIRAKFVEEGFRTKPPVEYGVVRAVCELFGVQAEPTVDPVEDVAHIISAGMFHKESSPELVREIAQEVVGYFKEENNG